MKHPPKVVQFKESAALEAALRRRLAGEVRFDAGSRALYATDASNYRQVPIGVVCPRSVDDVLAAVDACRAFGAPVLSRGGGTSLAGQCCNTAVVLDMSKYFNGITEIDPARRIAHVEPGVVLDEVRAAAERHHLTFGPDPATHNHCTIGGMIGNNSCGVHSVMAGKTVDNIEALDILTYDGLRATVGATGAPERERIIAGGGRRGEIYAGLDELCARYAPQIRQRYPDIPRRVSGYNLNYLLPENGFHVARALVGSEGTCVTILGAALRLVPSPPGRTLLVLGYPDIFTAADSLLDVLALRPIALEGIDEILVNYMRKKGLHPSNMKLLPEGEGWLLAEFGGETAAEAERTARRAMDALRRSGTHPPSMRLFTDPEEAHRIWTIRESGLGATANVPGEPDTWPGWEDSAVPPEKVGAYLRELRALLQRYGYTAAMYGHFGDGCIHMRINFDLVSVAGIARYRSFIGAAADLVLAYGGSLSGEHGDGQARAELLPKMFGAELLEAFGAFKRLWDPAGKMNPGKIVDAFRADENLRLGAGYRPATPATEFAYPDDHGSLTRAALRCVGVGECRRADGGTMCPSYRATREEMHSTRGRARLLHEMLVGNLLGEGWRSRHVHDALDLCLACKGCKFDCPVNVDMATYKAEFFAHYYQGRLRPAAAYSMGLIYWWARLASRAPGLANAFAQAPLLGDAIKLAGGVARERALPRFARQTFRAWLKTRPLPPRPDGDDRPEALLWADTFNNHFTPEVARAACESLEALGYRVAVPPPPLCCGRPLYDFGMLGLARRLLRRTLDALDPWLVSGIPIVVLEPSCLAVFRDELINLFPHDEHARRLHDQAVSFGEFLSRRRGNGRPLPAPASAPARSALVHGHCHQKAVIGMEGEMEALKTMGLAATLLDSGCCGMAGSFGFERSKYNLSLRIGEHELFPALRATGDDTLIIADGFSCREQIAQGVHRHALHLAEVVRMEITR